jgi:hypothetical protein
MASEAVQVIVSADDQASQKFAQIAANAEQSVRKIKDSTKATKSTAEFAGVLGNLMGGSAFGQIAGQIGQISEKVSQFSEVSTKGGAGALAFKGGLIAMAGVLGYQVGAAISNAVLGLEEFNKNVAEAEKKSIDFANKAQQSMQRFFGEEMQDIELIRDPEAKAAAYKSLTEKTNANIRATESAIADAQKRLEHYSSWATYWNEEQGGIFASQANERRAERKNIEQEIEQARERLSLQMQQRQSISELTNERAKELEEIKKRNSELDKEESYIAGLEKQLLLLEAKNQGQSEFNQLTAEQNTFTDEGALQASYLLGLIDEQNKIAEEKKKAEEDAKKSQEDQVRQREQLEKLSKSELEKLELKRIALEQGAEAAKKEELIRQGMDAGLATEIAAKEAALEAEIKAADEKQRREEKLAESRKKVLDDLAKQKVLIEQGEEAARSFALQQEGFGKDEADRVAAQEAALRSQEKEKELQKKLAQGPGPLSAVESRLLTRGPSANPMLQVANQQLQTQTRIAVATEKSAAAKGMQVRFVGGGAFRA